MLSGPTVVTAPALEPLFEQLAERLAAEPLPPLQRETILVGQNRGLRAWLEQALAQRVGCAAALDLRAPRSFAEDLARALVPGAGADLDRHPFDAAPLAWRISAFLDQLPSDPLYHTLRAYLDRTGGSVMPLARRLAQLFDDYQVYRPDILTAWAEGRLLTPDFPHEDWQADLWQRLRIHPDANDRATSLAHLRDRLCDPIPEQKLPQRIAVFGAPLFPPIYSGILDAVAQHIPVTLYTVLPANSAPDGAYDHPLLRALGERTRDFWTVLGRSAGVERTVSREACGAPPQAFQASLPLPTSPQAPDGDSALHQLQAAIAHDTDPVPTPLPDGDRSIRIHDAHSEVRELEALRDDLLDAFAELDDLRPNDVLVILPDLQRYAPLVDAVFGAEDATGDRQFRIPYHVVDHPHAPALRVLDAFYKALRLHNGRVTASELLDLLDFPVVRRRAAIREEELPLLRQWIKESGVCWGLAGDRKAAFGLPQDDLHTWRFGLDRLLLAIATGPPTPGQSGLVLGHLPCDAAGLSGADLLGRFAEWTDALFDALAVLDRSRPLSAWPDHLLRFVEGLFAPQDDDEIEAVVFLRQQMGDLVALHHLAGDSDADVSFYAVRAHLESVQGAFERMEPFLTGRVTFAAPMTLRHVPHRVIAFVGLNDGVYPGPESSPGFDLIAHAPRPGDASPRANEKAMFLDAILAARDRLILSYVGRSQKDNSERAASVVLDALLDAAERHWGPGARHQLVVRHRLQPFASEYFTGDGPSHSYAAQHRVRRGPTDAILPFLAPNAPPLPDGPTPDGDASTIVPLRELAEAWTSPSRFVARRRLRVSLDLDEGSIRDDEPVTLHALDAYHVRAAVLDGLLDGLTDDDLQARLLRSGLLPGGAPGAAWLRKVRAEAQPVADAVRAWGPTEPRTVDLTLGDIRLTGTLDRVGERGALAFRAGKVRNKHLVTAWIEHLALCADRPGTTGTVGTADTSRHFVALDTDDARLLLSKLIKGYHRARTRSLPLYEFASHAYAAKLNERDLHAFTDRILGRTTDDRPFNPATHAMRAAGHAFDPWGDAQGDAGDPYVQLVTRGRDPFVPEEHFAKWALGLWAPLLTHRRDGLPL